MPSVTKPYRRRFGLGLIVALGLPFAPAAADQISARIEVYGLLGLHVLTLHTHLEEASGRYAITADYATAGVAGLVVNQRTHSRTRGRIAGDSVQPDWFRSDTVRNGAERQNRVDYRPDGTVDGNSTPPLAQPIAVADMRGTVDNLSAYFRLEHQLAAKRSCALTVPVFDGRHRYDLIFSDGGQQKLSPEGGQKIAATAIVCKMKRHDRGVPDSEREEGAQRGTIMYAPLLPGGDVLVPVRMQLETQIGSVDAYLAELHGRGVDLQLME